MANTCLLAGYRCHVIGSLRSWTNLVSIPLSMSEPFKGFDGLMASVAVYQAFCVILRSLPAKVPRLS